MNDAGDKFGSDGEGEGFLGRWSKRKAQARVQPEVDADDPSAVDARQAPEKPEPSKTEEPVFDLSSLPSLEEITAQTNLADFMRKEVPAALRNAALKKAWALDPVIRDYVNPAMEYAYNWNAPGGVPGNGPIESGFEALQEMVAKAQSNLSDHTLDLGVSTDVAQTVDPETPSQPSEPVRLSAAQTAPNAEEVNGKTDGSDDILKSDAKPSQVAASDLGRPKRRHGGALPG